MDFLLSLGWVLSYFIILMCGPTNVRRGREALHIKMLPPFAALEVHPLSAVDTGFQGGRRSIYRSPLRGRGRSITKSRLGSYIFHNHLTGRRIVPTCKSYTQKREAGHQLGFEQEILLVAKSMPKIFDLSVSISIATATVGTRYIWFCTRLSYGIDYS